jgi:hypothetical protein
VTDIEAFVTLQPNQIRLERCGGRRRKRRLANARLSLEKERPLQAERQE